MDIIDFRKKYGVSLYHAKCAIKYAKGDEKIAVAFIKAKTIAVTTPGLSFDERVRSFLDTK